MDADRLDPRLADGGLVIPSVTYSDQPYVVVADDGAWVCVLTTGAGREGEGGQHVICQRSVDRGATWGDRCEIEPPDGPEASWAVIAKAPGGRLFVFYTYNRDNLREVPAVDPAFSGRWICRRVDSLGVYAFRYSDDHGRT